MADPAPVTVGRTTADAAVDIIALLWKQAPWLVVVAGAVYAIMLFQDQSREADAKIQEANEHAQEQYEKSLVDTRQALLEAYTQISAVSKQQIDNMRELLQAQDEVTAKLAAQRKEQEELQADLREQKEQAAAAQEEIRDAEVRKAAMQKDLEDRLKTLTSKAEDLGKLEKELKDRTAELDRNSKQLSERADSIDSLKASLSTLVDAILSEESGGAESAVAPMELAQQMRAEILQDPKVVLAAYAQSQTDATRSALRNLVGAQRKTLEAIAHEGGGFDYWTTAREREGDSGVVFVAARQATDGYDPLLWMRIVNDRVVEVDAYDRLVALRLPDLYDWNREVVSILVPVQKRTAEHPMKKGDQKWSVLDSLAVDFDNPVLETIHGDNKDVDFLTPEQLQAHYPEAYQTFIVEGYPDEQPRAGLAMLERAAAFKAASMAGMDQKMPAELRAAMTRLFDACIGHDMETATNLLDYSIDSETIGKIGATLLRPRVRLSLGDPAVADAGQHPEQFVTAAGPGNSATQAAGSAPTAMTVTIFTSDGQPGDSEFAAATLRFRQTDPSSDWQLYDYIGP